jgi:MoxR-like ATPase
MLPDALRKSLADAQAQVNTLLLGKGHEVRLAFVALLSDGHLLIEDLPGLGKTTLAHAMAATLGLGFQRVQFTSDLLPADILGVSVFDAQARRFEFHPGPIFAHVLLADEINRAPPRTQSALLEAMAEHQVTVDGTTHALPNPFFVIATQNPVDLAGTYPLPDSQLDRFLLRLNLGYPNEEAERALLAGTDRRALIAQSQSLLARGDVLALRTAAASVHASDALVAYVQRCWDASRRHPGCARRLVAARGPGVASAPHVRTRCSSAANTRCPRTCRPCSPPWPRIASWRTPTPATARALARAILHAVPRRLKCSPHLRTLRGRLERFVRPRTPEPFPVELHRRRIYVLPTRFGLFFGVMLVAMGVGALNYNNNPALLLMLLLAGAAAGPACSARTCN